MRRSDLFDPSTDNRYANDDPTNLTDPNGKFGIDCAFALTSGLLENVIGIAAVIAGGATLHLSVATLKGVASTFDQGAT